MLPNPEIREVTIQDYLKIIKKRLWIIIAFLVIIPTVVTIRVSLQKPVYRATASILIEASLPKITKFEEVYTLEAGTQYYQTQYKILISRALAERVLENLQSSQDVDYSGYSAARLLGQLDIQPDRNSQIVWINVEDENPLRAAAIANIYAKIYIEQDIEARNRATKAATGWLESQMGGIKTKLRESEEALNEYIQKNRIVTMPDIEQSSKGLLEGLKGNKSNLETGLAEALKRYKYKHPKVIALTAQLDDTNKKIEQETNRLLDLNQNLVQYNMLKKEVESNQQLYTVMLTRTKETDVSEKIETSRIRILDSAKPPSVPFKPQKKKAINSSILIALFCGIGLSLFLEYLDSSIRTAEDVSSYLSLPFLGYVPSVTKEAKSDSERNLICFQKPQSTITESYRAVRTSIIFASPEDKPLKSILITSSLPAEGKSFVTSNLATVFAQVNERVICLDIDMRRPKLHKAFNIENKNGISNFLIGTVDLEKIIRPTNIPNLSFICSGTIPPNPSELLSSAKIRLLLEELKQKYDRIIIDSPPILSVADTSLLSNIVDGIIFIVKGASTRLEATVKAKAQILKAKGRIIGVVINNIEPEKEDRYYYYHYYYSEEAKKQAKI